LLATIVSEDFTTTNVHYPTVPHKRKEAKLVAIIFNLSSLIHQDCIQQRIVITLTTSFLRRTSNLIYQHPLGVF
ncbi:MAG: hypothetical protein WKF91_22860, partial [Segetibacter sp.]